MANTEHTSDRTTRRMRYVARALALVWAGWWVFFAVATLLGEPFSPTGLLIGTGFSLIFLGSAIIPWRWEAIGGIVLMVEGLAVLIGYPVMAQGRFPLSTIILMLLTMALPPLVAGLLFLASRRRARGKGTAQKTLLLLLLAIFLFSTVQERPFSGYPRSPFACTSFAVYSEETLYGMNFDYPDVEIRFTIHPSGDLKVFQMEFLQEGGFVPTVGMNSAGLFGSCQMLFPEASATTSPGADDIYPWELYRESLLNLGSVEEVSEFISDKRVVHWSLTLHDLFADTRGDAMVVEAGDEENMITRIEDEFIVMTNFPNGDFAGRSYEEVSGAGAERYKIAYEHISDNVDKFDLNHGLETLRKAISSGDWPTQCSMVFNPERNEVFIALDKDFDRIWKVSIEDETIETYSGFKESVEMELSPSGVLASDLQSHRASRGLHWGYVIGCAVVLVGGVCVVMIRKRS